MQSVTNQKDFNCDYPSKLLESAPLKKTRPAFKTFWMIDVHIADVEGRIAPIWTNAQTQEDPSYSKMGHGSSVGGCKPTTERIPNLPFGLMSISCILGRNQWPIWEWCPQQWGRWQKVRMRSAGNNFYMARYQPRSRRFRMPTVYWR